MRCLDNVVALCVCGETFLAESVMTNSPSNCSVWPVRGVWDVRWGKARMRG